MERETVDQWVQRYVRAWESNSPEDIAGLFTEDARYWTAPHREPWTGREGIVQGWLDRKDEPGQWSFRHETLAVAGDLAFVRGWTEYPRDDPSSYSNLWMIRMTDDGRAAEFTEWWMAAAG